MTFSVQNGAIVKVSISWLQGPPVTQNFVDRYIGPNGFQAVVWIVQ